jgi:hypothetical protein
MRKVSCLHIAVREDTFKRGEYLKIIIIGSGNYLLFAMTKRRSIPE